MIKCVFEKHLLHMHARARLLKIEITSKRQIQCGLKHKIISQLDYQHFIPGKRMEGNAHSSLETPPVKLSSFNPLESFHAYSPLTPGHSPEGIIFEVASEEESDLKLLSTISANPVNEQCIGQKESEERDQLTKVFITPQSSPYGNTEDAEEFVTVLVSYDTSQEKVQSTEDESKKVKRRRVRHQDDTITDSVQKPTTRALQYPPCSVCGGKASGDHYGVNSCEACKGFFRRYLLREKGAYQCKKGGNCEVVHSIKGICAGCRLRKCLDLGMAKEKCKLGRYSSEKRTEKIKTALELQGGQTRTQVNQTVTFQEDNIVPLESPCLDTAQQDEIISRTLSQLNISKERQNTFCDELVSDLIKAKDDMRPFDKDKCLTDEEIKSRMKEYYDNYMLKEKMYGEMKTVPKEEFTKLYGDFGIDVDDRMKDLKVCQENIETEVNNFCNFAKRIPYFSRLSFRDQSNLLKAGRMDFYTTMACQGYDPDLQIYLHKFRAYHINEMDKFFSKELIQETVLQYQRCQKLNLNDSEKSLVMAICLFFTDRCSLENSKLVEMIQLSLVKLLRRELEKTCPRTAHTRFTKIIDYLTSLRESGEQYFKEYEDLCRDDLYVNECPVLTDFLFET